MLKRSTDGRWPSAIIHTIHGSGSRCFTRGEPGIPPERRSIGNGSVRDGSLGILVGSSGACLPGGPTTSHPECAGRREHWLAVDARAMREWAMALPKRLHVERKFRQSCAATRPCQTITSTGQGHHSHRLPIGKWACPFTPGVNCSTDDWMNLYAEHIMTLLTSDLPHPAKLTS